MGQPAIIFEILSDHVRDPARCAWKRIPSGLNGADFAKQYHDDRVSAHKDALSLVQR
jgi:hypothetical protein